MGNEPAYLQQIDEGCGRFQGFHIRGNHQQELASRIKYYENDRQVISKIFQTCIDPMNTASHLVNIVSGHICTDEVNVYKCYGPGQSPDERI